MSEALDTYLMSSGQKTMKLLKETFNQSFQLEFDDLFQLPEDLTSIYPDRSDDNYFYYTNLGDSESIPYLSQGSIGKFMEEAPPGYLQIGLWGHGVNSYGFYFCRVNEWSKVFFRLSYGGVYMDNDEEAEKIRKFLPAFFKFEEQIRGKAEHFIAVDSMGAGYYAVQVGGKPLFEIRESLYDDILQGDRFLDLLTTIE